MSYSLKLLKTKVMQGLGLGGYRLNSLRVGYIILIQSI